MSSSNPMRHRVAIVGLGMAVTPHVQALLELSERVDIATAFSPTASRREAFGARYRVPVVESLEPVLADRSIDSVAILTPPRTHRELVARCAAAGKQILVEKPVDVTYAEAVAVVESAATAGVRLSVCLQHRFRAPARELMRLVRAGELGDIANTAVSVRWWRPQSYYDEPGRGTLARDGGGVLLTQAIHTLDLFVQSAPRIRELVAFGATSAMHRMETEDCIAGALRFENGAIGSVDATTAAFPGGNERIDVVGTRGTASLVGAKLDVRFQDGRVTSLGDETGTGGGADPMAFSHAAHRAMYLDFFDALDEGRDAHSSAASALPVHALIDRLLESARRGGMPVLWD